MDRSIKQFDVFVHKVVRLHFVWMLSKSNKALANTSTRQWEYIEKLNISPTCSNSSASICHTSAYIKLLNGYILSCTMQYLYALSIPDSLIVFLSVLGSFISILFVK